MKVDNRLEILCYGDSNTWGHDPVTGERHGYNDRWPTVAGKELGERYHLIPEGLNGRTTVLDDTLEPWRNGLDYLRPCLISHKPLDAVVIMLGTNDTKARFSLPAGDIGRGIRQLARAVLCSEAGRQQAPPRVGIVAPPLVQDESSFGGTFGGAVDRSRGLAEVYQDVAKELQIPFLDAAKHVSCPVPDGIHLDAAGQATLGKAIAWWIEEALLP